MSLVPRWLGRQSLDIFFPDANIGIEHQGSQHSEPISYFGGEAAFTAQIERDLRKRELCRTHGCLLIEVFPGYGIDHVITQVRAGLAR